jgi:hypothetical protein
MCSSGPREVSARLDRLAKCDSEQARAEQHKAGCGYYEESIGHEVMIAHGTPAAWSCPAPPRTERYAAQVKRILRKTLKIGI